MTKITEREKAIELRKQNKSLAKISAELNVSKSTASYWLRDYPLQAEILKSRLQENARAVNKKNADDFQRRCEQYGLIEHKALHENLTTNLRGEIAALKIQIRAAELGYVLSKPTTDVRYDFVLDDGEKLKRVQVKYANGKSDKAQGSIVINLVSDHGNGKVLTYSAAEIDLILVYLPLIDKVIRLPDSCLGKTTFTVRYNPPKNGLKSGMNFVEDLIW
jgi:transposase